MINPEYRVTYYFHSLDPILEGKRERRFEDEHQAEMLFKALVSVDSHWLGTGVNQSISNLELIRVTYVPKYEVLQRAL